MKRVVQLALIVITCISLSQCSNDTSPSVSKPNSNIETPTDLKFEIVRMDNRDPIINLDVYVQDTTKLNDINIFLVNKYNMDKDKFLTIMYFDDKKIAKVWHQKLEEDMKGKVTENEWLILEPHRLGEYNSNPTTKYEEFQRDTKKK